MREKIPSDSLLLDDAINASMSCGVLDPATADKNLEAVSLGVTLNIDPDILEFPFTWSGKVELDPSYEAKLKAEKEKLAMAANGTNATNASVVGTSNQTNSSNYTDAGPESGRGNDTDAANSSASAGRRLLQQVDGGKYAILPVIKASFSFPRASRLLCMVLSS